ncbi:MAG TPA: glycosyltransferase [Bacteroidia bacterium]|jgi:cellulose synthase/poly-beta-1,6-N-acetylglucosamine synthase-like glycosyltransferase|nr:glycosyltransferase [Bacteroidia bacterium]
MTTFFFLLVYLFVALFGMYCLFIISFCFGWLKTKGDVDIDDELNTEISIIIAARNEEDSIASCLRALVNQSYPAAHMEIIVVNDHSVDNTVQIVQRFCEQYQFIQLISLDDQEHGKKQALQKGVAQAKGELIFTTDADCVMGMDWLRIMISYQKKTNAEMVVAPVCFNSEKCVFEKMQTLEFMALMASGGGALYFNKAVLCNGANLMYTRKAFDAVNGFDQIDEYPSGDDVLLMYKINKKFPGKIKFLKNQDVIVYTSAKKTWQEFMQQRKRWASKKITQLNNPTKILSINVYLFNFLLFVLPLLYMWVQPRSCQGVDFVTTWLLIFCLKCGIDFLLLFLAATFFNKKKWLPFFIPEQVLYVPYVVFTGFQGMFGNYVWKGRKIKNK